MNSSNSFNICPRCGNSNTLNAKYCSRCGSQLKVPEEAIVCHKCHTRNSPLANFCRNCGTTMKVGAQTKVCPRCGKEVASESNVCACGYSFVTLQQAAPAAVSVADVAPNKKAAKQTSAEPKKAKGKKVKQPKQKAVSNGPKIYKHSGGRILALLGLIFVLAFVYFVMAPIGWGGNEFIPRLDFLKGFDGSIAGGQYGLSYVEALVGKVMDVVGGKAFGEVFNFSVSDWVLNAAIVLFALCAVVHLIVCIVRIFSGRRSKKANGFYLFLAILTTIAVGLFYLVKVAPLIPEFLGLPETLFNLENLGWVLLGVPGYFWFMWIYSLIAKARTIKEKVA